MILNDNSFVKHLKIAFIGERSVIHTEELTYAQIEDTLSRFETEDKEGFIELSDRDEIKTMIVYGQKGAYHIGIVANEDEFYYYWNGLNPSEKIVAIAGNYFKKHQVCSDYKLALEIIQYFYYNGNRLEKVKWES